MNRNMNIRKSRYVLNIVYADINNTMLHACWTLCMCVRLLSRLCVTSLLPKRPLARGSVTAGRRCAQRSSGLAASRWLRRWCVMNVLMSSKFPMVELIHFASGLHSAMNEPIVFQLKRGPIKVLRCCSQPPPPPECSKYRVKFKAHIATYFPPISVRLINLHDPSLICFQHVIEKCLYDK